MQLGVDNADGELLPGGFANVSFELPAQRGRAAHPGQRADLRQATACASRRSTATTRSA